jgi:hypothetical protein
MVGGYTGIKWLKKQLCLFVREIEKRIIVWIVIMENLIQDNQNGMNVIYIMKFVQ